MTKPGSHTTDVCSNSSPNLDCQDDMYDGHPDDVVDALPTEGYYIFDTRPVNVLSPHLTHTTFHVPHTSFTAPTPDDTGPSHIVKILAYAGTFSIQYWSRIMLTFVPLGLAAPYFGFHESAVFVLNCLAIVPLADVLCQATDSLASFMGETAGALVNVTMGNLTELVIFIQALVHRQNIIVRTSLLGSIVVNILLVLGLAILIGEGQERGQVYNVLATRVAAGLLCLTTMILLIPSTVKLRANDPLIAHQMTNSSRAASVVLIIVYFVYIWTQIRSAKFAYKPLIQLDDLEVSDLGDSVELGMHRRNLSYPRAPSTSPPLLTWSDSKSYNSFETDSKDLSYPVPTSSIMARTSTAIELMLASAWVRKMTAVILLIISTGLISVCSENMVSRIDHFVAHSLIPKTMVGLIILPIVGNAAELISSTVFASRKQMDLAFAVSIGSAIQIALFVTPLIVLIGWGIDRDMSLHFTPFESVALAASSALFLMLAFDNRCSTLKGVCLCAGYAVIAIASWFVANGD